MLEKESPLKGIIKSMGLVFGDIGTSPIYTITVIFLLTKPTADNITGVLSLIVWTLIILVTIEYAWLAMSLGKKGEGGTIVLREILIPLLKSGRHTAFVILLSFIGVSLLIGDGIITPSISILSAVEGLLLIPGLEKTPTDILVFIAGGIALALFAIQKKGTEKVARTFGPLMALWFLALAVSGLASILHVPSVLKAVNPYYAISFLYENGVAGFFVLSGVILCATGGEALYADMGHLGRMPILRAWYFVFAVLLLNYLGQGAFLIQHPDSKNVLFEMIFYQARILYIPFLVLSIAATVIASQAMISGMFSIVFQGINTRIMPLFKMEYTSTELRSQIYIGSVNWFLLISVLFVMFEFKESHRLSAAYGLAVTGTMTLTGIMMTWIFYLKNQPALSFISLLVTIVDTAYLTANFYKIPHGGYWSLILALIPLLTILLYTRGQRRLYRTMQFMPLDEFLHKFKRVYATAEKIKGTALFLIRDIKEMPFYITQTMFYHSIIYKDSILVSMIKRDDPFGVTGFFKEDITEGLRVFEIQFGYMEVVDVEEILREAGIEEKTIFYGIEDITTRSAVWKVFSIFKRLTPPFVQFYKFPPHKLHGVITRLEM
ncbi:MAG: KUP/HAK/KT family potassium transporter [Nitrospirae bacterium]|nr:KUP/HAK/KT family potassium transporter [Nitrospirota bacterium]